MATATRTDTRTLWWGLPRPSSLLLSLANQAMVSIPGHTRPVKTAVGLGYPEQSFIMSNQQPRQPIELQADAVVQLDAIERSGGVIRGMLARVLPNMFGTGYVLHLLGDGTQGDSEYALDFVYLDAMSGAVYELDQVDGGIISSLLRVAAALRYLPQEEATALSRGHLTLLGAELDARIALWQRCQAEQPTERPAAHLLWPLQAGAAPPMTTAITA